MKTNIRWYPAHLRTPNNMIATDGYAVSGRQLVMLRKTYRALRRSTGSAVIARLTLLDVMGAGRNCPLDTTGIDAAYAARTARAVAA